MHPYMTEELVGQRRAALHAEARHARLASQVRRRARGDPERLRLTTAAWTLVHQVRAMVARAA